jgi:hypothetical protein
VRRGAMTSLVGPPQSGHSSLLVAAAGNSTVFRAGPHSPQPPVVHGSVDPGESCVVSHD